MQYQIAIAGDSPILFHDVIRSMDRTSAANREKENITGRRGKRTAAEEERLQELEAFTSISLTVTGEIGIPERSLRTMLEESAKTLKQGADVRQGLVVKSASFDYDRVRYGDTLESMAKTAQFTIPVKVQRSTILRTRAKIDPPWGCRFDVDTDPDLVDVSKLENWLDIGGRRIGLCDWRPAKSGIYGTFSTVEIKPLA